MKWKSDQRKPARFSMRGLQKPKEEQKKGPNQIKRRQMAMAFGLGFPKAIREEKRGFAEILR